MLHTDGNQVWLLTAGGAIFAAWPIVYSVAFSGFYIALFLVLAALFFRPIGFEYRAKLIIQHGVLCGIGACLRVVLYLH